MMCLWIESHSAVQTCMTQTGETEPGPRLSMTSTIQIPASALLVLQPEQYTYEEHFIIRFPPGLAASVRSDLQETGLPGDLEINFSRTSIILCFISLNLYNRARLPTRESKI